MCSFRLNSSLAAHFNEIQLRPAVLGVKSKSGAVREVLMSVK